MSSNPIPAPSEADLKRDAAFDYGVVNATAYKQAWIRRAVAAEAALAAERAARDIECNECGRTFTPTPKVSVCCECVADLQARLAQAEAGAAAMRQWLEMIYGWFRRGQEDKDAIMVAIGKALATDAGRALLARLEAAEAWCEKLAALVVQYQTTLRHKEIRPPMKPGIQEQLERECEKTVAAWRATKGQQP